MHWAYVAATAFAAFIGVVVVLQSLKRAKSKKKLVGVVKQLWLFPIKSCGGIKIDEAACTNMGFQAGKVRDRHFIVATADEGLFVTQRQIPKMALIRTSVGSDDCLHVDAPEMSTLSVDLNGPKLEADHVRMLRVFSDNVPGLCCGDEAANWFSQYLGKQVRLYYSHSELAKRGVGEGKSHREMPRSRSDQKIAYSDAYPYHLANEESLDELNTRLPQPIPMLRFRPNIIMSGAGPYAEDSFRSVWIGEQTKLYHEKLCDRCIVPNVDHIKGEKDPNQQPQTTLKTYRIRPHVSTTSPCFAINLVLEKEGMIKVGDEIYADTA